MSCYITIKKNNVDIYSISRSRNYIYESLEHYCKYDDFTKWTIEDLKVREIQDGIENLIEDKEELLNNYNSLKDVCNDIKEPSSDIISDMLEIKKDLKEIDSCISELEVLNKVLTEPISDKEWNDIPIEITVYLG